MSTRRKSTSAFCRMRLPRFVHLRIAILLACLLAVGLVSAHQRVYSRHWYKPLEVTVYPLNGDGQRLTNAYIQSLSTADFADIDAWGVREAQRHDLVLDTPFVVTLGPRVETLPPEFPETAGVMDVLLWNLRFRWWAWHHSPEPEDSSGGLTRVRLFVVYHQGQDGQPLAHSLGMQKGLLGLIHAFAIPTQSSQNNIVIAHELLHTVGAADKYGPRGEPLYPEGYADALQSPRFPQRHTEIMAGRTPLSPAQSSMPDSLRRVRINALTAGEINWLQSSRAD